MLLLLWRVEPVYCFYTNSPYGAGGQIRTDDEISLAGLQNQCYRPLSHTSISINNYMNLLELINTFSGIIALAVLFIAIAKIFQ
jgi:hypothetical protein